MKRGYLENDEVEPGVCRGGGISQRPKVLQAISNSQLETPAKQQSCLAVRVRPFRANRKPDSSVGLALTY